MVIPHWCALSEGDTETLPPAPRPPVSPDCHPGYRLHRFLGAGGFGQVWSAETPQGGFVALKFLRCRDGRMAFQELRSLQLVSRLRHTNLLPIHRVWAAKDCLIIAMEQGDATLFDLFKLYQSEFRVPIPAADLLPLLADVAAGIDFLNRCCHEIDGQRLALGHSDINPRNMLLVGDTAKVSDFSLTSPITVLGQTRRRGGTPEYAAPEMFQGFLSARTDQYALAVSYCLLRGGRLPFIDTPPASRLSIGVPKPI
jgi:serine/threonine protein kinase, bacterial